MDYLSEEDRELNQYLYDLQGYLVLQGCIDEG